MNGMIQSGAALMILTGCVVGPNYNRPSIATRETWASPIQATATNWQENLAGWWKQFNDPQLDSLIERATLSNLDLKIAQARVRESRARYGIAASDFFPTVDASSGYARVGTSHHQPVLGSIPIPRTVPFENNFHRAGLDASWELDVFGGTRREVEAATADVAADEDARRATVVTLLAEVALNYLDVRGQQRRLAIARANIAAQEHGLALTRTRYTNGLVSNIDVQQASGLLATTRADVSTLESNIAAAIYRLDVLVAEQPGTLKDELSTVSDIPTATPIVPVGLPSELLLRRPDVRRAERQLAAATARIGVATADLFPKFFLTGTAGFESVSVSDWFTSGSKFWSIGPTVQWKIFDAGRIRSNIKVLNARQEQVLAAYEKTALTAFEDVENALVYYAKEQIRRTALQEAVRANENSLDLARKLYANGFTGFLNVLDAERSLYSAQDLLARSDLTVSANLVGLYKALGGGWETFEPAQTLAKKF